MSGLIHKEFHQELLYQMDKNFQCLSEDIVLQILQFATTAEVSPCENLETLKQFAIGKRAYFTCKRLLKEYLINNPTCLLSLTTQEQALLVAALLQNITDQSLAAKFSLSGKKQIEQALKMSFAKILIAQ